jgi:hypothetical protein
MDLGLATLNVKKPETPEKEETLVLKLREATIEFNRECDRIERFTMHNDKVEKVIQNIATAQAVLENFGASDAVLHLINGQENQLCQIMGWDELPAVTEDNKQELAEGITEGLGGVAAKTWELIQKFFGMIGKMLGSLLKAVMGLVTSNAKMVEKEVKRLQGLKNPSSTEDATIVYGTVTQDDMVVSDFSIYIDAEKSLANLSDKFMDQMEVISEAAQAIEAYLATGANEQFELDVAQLREGTETIKSIIPKYNADAENETTLAALGVKNTGDAITVYKFLVAQLDMSKDAADCFDKNIKRLDKIGNGISKKDEVDEASLEKINAAKDLLSALITCQKENVSVTTTIIQKLMEGTSQIQEVEEKKEEGGE